MDFWESFPFPGLGFTGITKIHQAEFENVLGRENICDNVQEALRRAEEVYEGLETTLVGAAE
jgi:hypothetical protein